VRDAATVVCWHCRLRLPRATPMEWSRKGSRCPFDCTAKRELVVLLTALWNRPHADGDIAKLLAAAGVCVERSTVFRWRTGASYPQPRHARPALAALHQARTQAALDDARVRAAVLAQRTADMRTPNAAR
jgi:hypothetical protein